MSSEHIITKGIKAFCILHLVLCFMCSPAFALDFDISLDDEVRRNYDPNKIEADMKLPSLPKILNEEKAPQAKSTNMPVQSVKKPTLPTVQKPLPAANISKTEPQQEQEKPANIYQQTISAGNCAIIHKGTTVRTKIVGGISDRTRRGTKFQLISQYPVSTTYFTIPKGTVFTGVVTDSHGPQLSGNGGLIVLNVKSVTLDDGVHTMDAKITKVNFKNVFFNNIKGKRKYIKSTIKSTRPGRSFCKKMLSITGNLAQDGSSIILTPFSLGFGVLGLAGNVIVSPALGLLHKGDHVYIREGSTLEIKLLQDLVLYR